MITNYVYILIKMYLIYLHVAACFIVFIRLINLSLPRLISGSLVGISPDNLFLAKRRLLVCVCGYIPATFIYFIQDQTCPP